MTRGLALVCVSTLHVDGVMTCSRSRHRKHTCKYSTE
jgi:hypothetical protein